MNATTAFEHRRDALRAQLERAADIAEAERALTAALEQTACELMQDEQDERARQRQQAVLALAKRAPQLLRAATAEGELRADAGALKDAAPRAGLSKLQIAGGLILAVLAAAQLVERRPLYALLQLAGVALLMSRALSPTKAGAPLAGVRAVGVARVDAGEAVRAVGELMAAADVCVSDLCLLDQSRTYVGATADEATIDLLVSLMEAKATGRGDVALSSLAQAEQFLRALGVECVFYAPEQAAMFDLLPTLGAARTVRPALVKDGKLLRRGVAACAMGRSVGA